VYDTVDGPAIFTIRSRLAQWDDDGIVARAPIPCRGVEADRTSVVHRAHAGGAVSLDRNSVALAGRPHAS
jgi:hypothetical protein